MVGQSKIIIQYPNSLFENCTYIVAHAFYEYLNQVTLQTIFIIKTHKCIKKKKDAIVQCKFFLNFFATTNWKTLDTIQENTSHECAVKT